VEVFGSHFDSSVQPPAPKQLPVHYSSGPSSMNALRTSFRRTLLLRPRSTSTTPTTFLSHHRTFSAAPPRPTPPRATPVTWASLAVCMAVGTGLVTYYQSEKERRQTQVTMGSQTKTIGKAAIGGPWSLFNTNGRLVTDTDYRGKFQFVYFGFTRCPDICPNELVKIGKIFEKLESNPSLSGQIKPVFISIDPRRDTIDQLQEYSQDFHPSFDWLTGTPEQVNAVAKAYRVYWSKVDVTTDEDDDDEYSVDHTIVTYLMGPDGDFVDLFTSGVDSKQIIEKITNHVVQWNENHPAEAEEKKE
jgi:protein SCO1/2